MRPKSTCTVPVYYCLHVKTEIEDHFNEVDDDFWPSVNEVLHCIVQNWSIGHQPSYCSSSEH